MQGFFMVFLLFLFCAIFYDALVAHAIQAFQVLYFLSSFFGEVSALSPFHYMLQSALMKTTLKSARVLLDSVHSLAGTDGISRLC